MDILMTLSSNLWTWYMVPFICVFLNFFLQCSLVFCIQVLVKYIPRYLIFSCCYSKWDFFLVSVSDISLLGNKNVFNFGIFTLYPTILPDLHFRTRSFFGGAYRVFYVQYHVICKQCQFYFLLSNLDAFYFFFLSDCCG